MRHQNLLDMAARHAIALVDRGAMVWWALEDTRVVFGLSVDQVAAVRRQVLEQQDPRGEARGS